MVTNCIVQIGDESGNSFKVSVSTGWHVQSRNGNWRAIDNGFIRFSSGSVNNEPSNGTLTGTHIYFLSGDGTWGIRLNDFEDIISVNKEGTGFVTQPWVIGLKPGRISWALVS